MKKSICFILSVMVLLIVSDYLFGYAMEYYIRKNGLHGDYQPIEYVMKKCDADILAIGSSVVLNSFVPTVFEDSLGMSSYNAGANSQTLPYFHTILNCVLQRHTPKMVLLGLRPDELSGNDIGRYQLLVPYYHKGYDEIDATLESQSKYEKYLLQSNLYRYNTIWFRIVLYHFIRTHERSNKGFLGHSKPMFPPQLNSYEGERQVSNIKMDLLRDMISMCENRGVKLVLYFPPMYNHYENKPATVLEAQKICKEHQIPCYYDTEDSLFLSHQELFYDNVHLIKEGSYEYSKVLVSRIRENEIFSDRRER